MSYVCRLYGLYELFKLHEYLYESLKITSFLFFKKIGTFLLICNDRKSKL